MKIAILSTEGKVQSDMHMQMIRKPLDLKLMLNTKKVMNLV